MGEVLLNGIALQKVLDSYFRERDNLELVARKELLRRIRQGLVTVINTRPADEFEAGHVPCALSIPLRHLPGRPGAGPQGSNGPHFGGRSAFQIWCWPERPGPQSGNESQSSPRPHRWIVHTR